MDGNQVILPPGLPSFSEPQSTVIVMAGMGNDISAFTIHRETLCALSPYFRNRLARIVFGVMETVRLDNIEVEVFGQVVHYIYRFEVEHTMEIRDGEGGDNFLDYKLILLTKTWLAAEEYQMPRFQNLIMDALFRLIGHQRRPPALCELFRLAFLAREMTPLKDFAVNALARHSANDLAQWIGRIPEGMLELVTLVIATNQDHVRNFGVLPQIRATNFFVEIPEEEEEE
ncbi:hypothetical protein EG329_012765 [Mollisiaceae sp. DMI_Dod_QoI]|nr:hypothetical protein EG329_012765 [Helotiales sp. DMI_Dod_QoI]